MSFIIKRINPRSFWHFQIIGFAIFYFADLLMIFTTKSGTNYQVIAEATEIPTFFIISLGLRQIYKKIAYFKIPIPKLLIIILSCSLCSTVIWYFIITNINWRILDPSTLANFLDFRKAFNWVMTIFPVHLGWSILYFGIKIWIDWDNERLRAEKASILAQKAQLQLLRYQVNPHFLFNSLNSIRALVDEDQHNAKLMITELSEFLRYSLMSKNLYEIKLKDEIGAISHYISIEKKRYEEKLEIEFDIDPEIECVPVLGFLIHPLVENAVKYGMQTSAMPLKITIRAKRLNGRLKIEVINSGNWVKDRHREKVSGTGTGLENVRARLENAFKHDYSMRINEKKDSVSIELEMPINSDCKKD